MTENPGVQQAGRFSHQPDQTLWLDAQHQWHWIQCLAIWAPDDWHWRDPPYIRFITEASWANPAGPNCSVAAIASGEMAGNFIARQVVGEIRKAPVEPGTQLVVYRDIYNNHIYTRPLAEWLETVHPPSGARPRFMAARPAPFVVQVAGR